MKLFPDCDYFRDKRDDTCTPVSGECSTCYRFIMCLESVNLPKEKKDEALKEMGWMKHD